MKNNLKESHNFSDKFDGKSLTGLYTLYTHFFNILDKGENKVDALISEVSQAISISNCEKLELTSIDVSFVFILSRELLSKGLEEDMHSYVNLLASLKWLYKNDRKFFENSSLYNELSRSSRDTVVVESARYTYEKLRFSLKSIDAESKFLQEILDKSLILPSYRMVIVSLWGIIRNIKIDSRRRYFVKLLRTEEATCVIQCLFDKFYSFDLLKGLKVEVNTEGVIQMISLLVMSLSEDFSSFMKDLEVEAVSLTQYSQEELENINSELKNHYKELKISKHQEEVESQSSETGSLADIEEEVNEKLYTIDFGLSYQQKKELLATSKFLLLKSDDIVITSVMDNVRVESISSVANETLKGDYDAIVILTKKIWHADSFRIKSLIGQTPLIYTNRTNRRLIVEDMYNQF
jgi:hypothetical protein